MNAAAATFLTPRGPGLVLRSAATPSRQTTAHPGDPLLVTDQLADNFVEVDWRGERWFAQMSDLEPWRGATEPAASAGPRGPYAGAPQPGPAAPSQAGFYQSDYARQPAPAAPYRGQQPAPSFPVPLLPLLIAVCAVVALVGSFLPWAHVSFLASVDVKGFDYNDGKITLGLAVLAGLLMVVRIVQPQARIALSVVALLLLAGCAGVAIYDWVELDRGISRLGLSGTGIISVGWGLMMVAIAGGLGVLACMGDLLQPMSRTGALR